MKAKQLILGLSVAAFGLSSCTGNIHSTSASLKTKADTANFYIGYMYGSNLERSGITNPNVEAIVAGLNSAIQGKKAPADMMAMLIKNVIMVQIGISNAPNLRRGAAKALTKCTSQREAVTTAAKPMAPQIAGTNVGLVMPLMKALKAATG